MTNHTLQRQLFQTGAVLSALSVILGAFGAHVLKDHLDPSLLSVFETGVRYQFYHSLAILIIAASMRHIHDKVAILVVRLFFIGIVLFSGSLFILSTSHIFLGDSLQWIGVATPLGGVSFITGWTYLAVKGYKDNEGESGSSHHSTRHRLPNHASNEEERIALKRNSL